MNASDGATRSRVMRSRIALLLMVVIFASPPLAGWLFYLNPEWIPESRRNHGELITPPRPLRSLAVVDDEGAPFDWMQLADLWTFVVVADSVCDDTCTALIDHVTRVRRAIGADRLRTSAILLLLADRSSGGSDTTIEATGFRVVHAHEDGAREARTLFALDAPNAFSSLYLIDARGMLMMRHDLTELGAQEVIEDLEVLLAASHNWRTERTPENP